MLVAVQRKHVEPPPGGRATKSLPALRRPSRSVGSAQGIGRSRVDRARVRTRNANRRDSNPGAVVAIKVKSIAGDWEVAWQGAAERGRLPATSRVFSPPLVVPPSPYAVRCVRLELDTRGPGSWSEIDAVRMLPPVEVATPIVVAEVVACLPPEGGTANAGARPLHEVASTLKTALGVDGTILEVIHQSCQQLGVQREGKTLVEAAAQCEAVLHGGRGAAEPSVVPLL